MHCYTTSKSYFYVIVALERHAAIMIVELHETCVYASKQGKEDWRNT